MSWFIIYYVFAGLFSAGYVPTYPSDTIKVRLAVDAGIFLVGFLLFPFILGGAFRVWVSKKE